MHGKERYHQAVVEVRDTVKHPVIHRSAPSSPTHNYLGPNINSAELSEASGLHKLAGSCHKPEQALRESVHTNVFCPASNTATELCLSES